MEICRKLIRNRYLVRENEGRSGKRLGRRFGYDDLIRGISPIRRSWILIISLPSFREMRAQLSTCLRMTYSQSYREKGVAGTEAAEPGNA
jgi:hypothetical protein